MRKGVSEGGRYNREEATNLEENTAHIKLSIRVVSGTLLDQCLGIRQVLLSILDGSLKLCDLKRQRQT